MMVDSEGGYDNSASDKAADSVENSLTYKSVTDREADAADAVSYDDTCDPLLYRGGDETDGQSPDTFFSPADSYAQSEDSVIDHYMNPHGKYGTIDGTRDPFSNSSYRKGSCLSGTKQMEGMISGYRTIKNMGSEGEAWDLLRLLHLPDRSARMLNDPQSFKLVYPYASIATGGDAVLYFLFTFLIGFVIITIALGLVFSKYLEASEENFPIAGYVPVQATVNRVEFNYIYLDNQRKIRDYTVSCEYEYNGEKYTCSCLADGAAAAEYGFSHRKRSVGKHITLYVDPQAPQHSRISATPEPYPGIVAWLTPVPGVLMMIWSLIFLSQCISGRRVIYDSLEYPGSRCFKYIHGSKQAWRDVFGVSEF